MDFYFEVGDDPENFFKMFEKKFLKLEKYVPEALQNQLGLAQLSKNYAEFKSQFIKDYKLKHLSNLVENLNENYQDGTSFSKFIKKKISFIKNLIGSNNENELLIKLSMACLPSSFQPLVLNNLPMDESSFLDRCLKLNKLLNKADLEEPEREENDADKIENVVDEESEDEEEEEDPALGGELNMPAKRGRPKGSKNKTTKKAKKK